MRPWLPETAFTDSSVAPILATPVSAWAEHWFGRSNAAVGGVRVGGEAVIPPLVERGATSVGFWPCGKRVLVEAALTRKLSAADLRDGDRRLLEVLARRIAEDLAARLDGELPSGGDGSDRRVFASILLGDTEAVSVGLPLEALVPALKKRLARPTSRLASPKKALDALRATNIVADAVLGRVDIALPELRELGLGDVIVLETAIRQGVELRVSENLKSIGRGRLCRDGGQVSIQF